MDARGFIKVDERLRTTAPGVWAIGECAGSPQFTHVSVDDFRIVRDNMAGGNRKTSDRLIPHVVFTDPPLARVGLSEGEAQRQGIAVRVARLPMRKVLRTNATDETEGFMKVLVGATDDRILGFTMIGSEAGEVMAAIQTAMLADLPYTKLRDAVFAHLTVAEGLGPLFEAVPRAPLTRGLGLWRVRLQATACYCLPCGLGCVGEFEQREVGGLDHVFLEQRVEVHHAPPIGLIEQHDRHRQAPCGSASSVRISNSSSIVPKPPGNTTSALARIARCILRIAK